MHDIEAEIAFLTTIAGGRRAPAVSGYRAQFYCDGLDYDAVYHFPDVAQSAPGETVKTLIQFLSPDLVEGALMPGKLFAVREGHKIVAHGNITKILELGESAREARERYSAPPTEAQ